MKLFLPLVWAFTLVGCSPPISDPVGQPYRIRVSVTQPSSSTLVNLTADVAYGGFGTVKSTVDFLNGNQVLGSTNQSTVIVPYNREDPYNLRFQTSVPRPMNNSTLNVTARVRWTTNGVEKSLNSEAVTFQTTP